MGTRQPAFNPYRRRYHLGKLHVRDDEEPDVQGISAGWDMTRSLCSLCGSARHNRQECELQHIGMGLR